MTRRGINRYGLSMACTAVIALGASACGGDDSGLSEQAARGKQTSISNGCASCHGTDGRGGVGSAWRGLAGSERELTDGTTVIADDDYLLRSIREPMVEVVAGFSVNMPQNALTEEQAQDIIAYIKELDTSD